MDKRKSKVKGYVNWVSNTHKIPDRHCGHIYFFVFKSDLGIICKVGQGADVDERLRAHRLHRSVNVPKDKKEIFIDWVYINASYKEADVYEGLLINLMDSKYERLKGKNVANGHV